MKYKIITYDSFTNVKFKGNPAGVVLDADSLSKSQMQNIATELGYPETAFVSKSSPQIKVNFFTPKEEINLCGHATIAYVTALFENNKLDHLNNGWNKINIENNLGTFPILIDVHNNKLLNVLMYQDTPSINFNNLSTYESEILSALGINTDDLDCNFKIVKAYTGLWDLLIPVKNKLVLDNLKIDFSKVEYISKKLNIISFHTYCIDDNFNIYARNFAPIVNIYEEAATGTSNGALTYYLYSINKIKENQLISINQGESLNRESIINSKIIVEENNPKVLVGGTAIKVIDGIINI